MRRKLGMGGPWRVHSAVRIDSGALWVLLVLPWCWLRRVVVCQKLASFFVVMAKTVNSLPMAWPCAYHTRLAELWMTQLLILGDWPNEEAAAGCNSK